jgi:hypothetical protein
VWQPRRDPEKNTKNISTGFVVSAMADNHNLTSLSESLNPVAQNDLVEQNGQHQASKPEAQPQQHEYLVWPEKDMDGREQLELQNQIRSATGGVKPHRVMGSWPEKFLFWVVNVTPNVAVTIEKLSKVCFAHELRILWMSNLTQNSRCWPLQRKLRNQRKRKLLSLEQVNWPGV